MTLTIDLPEELEARLKAAAEARGTDPQTIIQDLVKTLPPPRSEGVRKSPAEALADWKLEGALGLFSDRTEDSSEIARQLRESLWKRTC